MSLSELSDDELITGFQNATQQTERTGFFEELWLRYEHVVDQALTKARLRGNVVEYRDLKQGVVEKVWRKLHTYAREAPFAAWLSTVARNHAVDLIRCATGMRRLGDLELTDQIESQLNRGTIPQELSDLLEAKKISKLRDPRVEKQVDDWIISSGIRTRAGRRTQGRYLVRINGDKLDIYRCRVIERTESDQTRKGVDQSDDNSVRRLNGHTSHRAGGDPAKNAEDDDRERALSRALAAKARMGGRQLRSAKALILIGRKGRTKTEVAQTLRMSGASLNSLLHENWKQLQGMLDPESRQ